MKKVSLQFTERKTLLLFLQTVDPQPCVVDFSKLSLICELTDEQLDELNNKFSASYHLLPELKERRIR